MKACAVCGYPLSRETDRDTGEHLAWSHIRPDLGDHIPVPVEPTEIRVNHRCDFCDCEPVTAVVICPTFTLPLGSISVGNWVACTPCDELIRRNRWSKLVTRVRQMPGRAASTIPRAGLEDTYRLVQVHMLGVISVTEWLERSQA